MIIKERDYLKRGTYRVNKVLVDLDTGNEKCIYENDRVDIKSPQDVKYEERAKFAKMAEDRDDMSNLVTSEFGGFYFNFINAGLDSLNIKDGYKLRFLYLCTYANYSQKGSYLLHRNGKTMDKKGIIKTLKLTDREGNNTLKELMAKGLVCEDSKGYMVNPVFVKRGHLNRQDMKKDYTRIFDKGVSELYEACDIRQHKQLYYLFKLLPFVNVKFNAICQNPKEEHPSSVIQLKLSEICEKVGYDKSKARRFEDEMLKFKINDEYVMLGIKNGNGMWYKINPRFSYGGTGRHMEGLLELLSTDFTLK